MRELMLEETVEELVCFRTIDDLYWHYASQHNDKVFLDIFKDISRTEP